MTDPAATQACPLCGASSRRWTGQGERELRRCDQCRFAWIPGGVMRTSTGRSIYEDDSSLSMSDEQVDYSRDESPIDAPRAKVAWVKQEAPAARTVLDVGANFGFFVSEAAAAGLDARGIEPRARVVEWG